MHCYVDIPVHVRIYRGIDINIDYTCIYDRLRQRLQL